MSTPQSDTPKAASYYPTAPLRPVPDQKAPSGQKATSDHSKTRVGGGFNPSVNVSFSKSQQTGSTAGQPTGQPPAAGGARSGGGTPGADFMSNEDIRKFCEYIRKEARNRATERSMDADHLEAVLRTIPTAEGSLAGSRARARRVSRSLKKIAAAEKAIQKYAAMLYGTFEREFEADLRKVGKARTQQQQRRAPFGWR